MFTFPFLNPTFTAITRLVITSSPPRPGHANTDSSMDVKDTINIKLNINIKINTKTDGNMIN
jgi:hypothetical protein